MKALTGGYLLGLCMMVLFMPDFSVRADSEVPDRNEVSSMVEEASDNLRLKGDAVTGASPGVVPHEKEKRSRFVPFPAVFYTPETRFGAVMSFIYLTYGNDKPRPARPDVISAVILYTMNRQFLFAGSYKDYLRDERLLWTITGSFARFPGKYYGIGSDTRREDEEKFINVKYSCKTSLQYRLIKGLFAGLKYDFTYYNPGEIQEDGLLAQSGIGGTGESRVNGAGVVADFDTRDNIFSSTRGMLLKTEIMLYAPGSDYIYQRVLIDCRSYHTLEWDDVVAFEFYGETVSGDPPFQEYPQLGGQNLMRGFYQGRFRDRTYMAAQAEYRFFFMKRWALVAFAGAGEVAGSPEGLYVENVKTAGGAGLRFYVAGKQRIAFRLDAGFSRDDFAVYFNMLEAF